MPELEVAFHLHEIRSGLRGAAELLDRLAHGEPLVGRGARRALADVASELDHVVEHHLAGLPTSRMPSPAPGAPRPAAAGGGEAGLARELATLRVLIDAARKSLDAGPAQLDELEATLREAQALAASVAAVAAELHREADPEAAARELQDAMLAVERCVQATPGAAELSQCPLCHAPLSSEDRTYEGSFCESCGTRWVTPA